jgi:hypothetical protein
LLPIIEASEGRFPDRCISTIHPSIPGMTKQKKEKWEKCRAVNTALCEVGWVSVYDITKDNKSHAPAWQVLNNRRSVSEPVTGSLIQSLTFRKHFSRNLANMDKIGMPKYFWF